MGNDDHDRSELGSERLEKGMRLAFGLASVQEGESILDALERVTGTDSRIHLHDVEEGESPVVRVPGAKSEDRGPEDTRYQIVGEIARGGVGVVFKGRDRDLGRDVAIKVLRKDLAASPEVTQRFIEEAQIEGQLQHPGIVPVYGLGMQPDGRPYFAMKFVKGETLAAVLKERRDLAESRRRLLTSFEQVCQAVAYAHARRVIHRDLKPANILLGAFGQVQVVDWGFAKVLSRGGVADEEREPLTAPDISLIETIRSGPGSSGSVAGSVMGTPAYMPPEQALGQVGRVDETSDVFSLGAILLEILTGLPPYTGKTSNAVLVAAAQAELEGATERLEECDADPALKGLVTRCLSPAQAVRPRNAGEVAEAISSHLASVEDRARRAELDAVAARTKAVEERKARKLTLALAAAVLLALVAGGGGLWLTDRKAREHEQKASTAVSGALEDVVAERGDVRAAGIEDLTGWPGLISEAGKTVQLAESTGADAETRARAEELLVGITGEAADFERRAARAAEVAATERRLARIRGKRGEDFEPADKVGEYTTAFREMGIDLDALPAEAAAAKIRESEIASDLIAALDDLQFAQRSEKVAEILSLADEDPWRTRIRQTTDVKNLAKLAKEPKPAERPLRSLHLLGDALGHGGDAWGAVGVYRKAQEKDSYDYWTNLGLGWWLLQLKPPRWDLATPCLTRAMMARRDSLAARYHLGWALSARGDASQAAVILREAHELDSNYGQVVDRLSKTLSYGINLLSKRVGMGAALPLAQEAAKLTPDEPASHFNLGNCLISLRRWEAAEASLRKAIALDPKFNHAHFSLGRILLAKGLAEKSIEAFEESLEVGVKPNREAAAYRYLGDAHGLSGRPEAALSSYRQALEKTLNTDTWGRRKTAQRLGETLLILGRYEELIDFAREELGKDDGSMNLCLDYIRALRLSGGQEELGRELDRWIEKCVQDCARGQDAAAYSNLGAFMGMKYPRAESCSAFRRALPDPTPEQEAGFCRGLAPQALFYHLDMDGYLACQRRILEVTPESVEAFRGIAATLKRQGDLDGAEEHLARAVEIAPGNHDSMLKLFDLQARMGRLAEALPQLERLVRENPDNPRSRSVLREFRRILALEPRIGAFVDGTDRPENGEDWYRAAKFCYLRGRWMDAFALFNTAMAESLPPVQRSGTPALRWARYYYRGLAAVCAARIAVSTDGPDAAPLRKKCVALLRESVGDLRFLSRIPGGGFREATCTQGISTLQLDPPYAPFRGEENLAKLPPDEAAEWRALWKDVRSLWNELR